MEVGWFFFFFFCGKNENLKERLSCMENSSCRQEKRSKGKKGAHGVHHMKKLRGRSSYFHCGPVVSMGQEKSKKYQPFGDTVYAA